MRASWLEAPSAVREVMEHLHGHGRTVAHTAMQPVPGLAEQKGPLRSDRSKLAYVCHASSFRERFRLARLKPLLDQLHDEATGRVAL